MTESFRAGSVLAEKYRLVAPLGSGGMGKVWRADHLSLSSPVAVKILNERAQQSEGGSTRFLREAQAAASLRSPNVVQIIDFGVEGETPFIVMELLEGESLAQRLARVGQLDLATTASIVSQTARALHKAHEAGVVHRDLKPDNIFLVRDVDSEVVKVLDFGIAKLVEQPGVDQLTGTGSVLGTPHYMSPEQARGRREVDQRTDLWALGVIAYQCTTGRRPFESTALGELLLSICTEPAVPPSTTASLPPALDAFMERALAKQPERRFGSALELAAAFAQIASQPVAATTANLAGAEPYRASLSTASPRKSTGRVLWLGGALVLGGALAVVVAAVGLFVYRSDLGFETQSAAPAASAPPVGSEWQAPLGAESAASPGTTEKVPVAETKPKVGSTPAPVATGTAKPKAAPAPTSTAKPSGECDVACAKLRGCGASCPPGICAGARLTAARCVNSKKTCVQMASCF